MPVWKAEPIWEGEDVFVIGGGTSLRHFDWPLLADEHTVGCNQAFRLGERICDMVIFGDFKFAFIPPGRSNPRHSNYDAMAAFKNPVVCNDPKAKDCVEPWIKWMPRKPVGLHRDALGWNGNTGASAINLALLLGAKNVFLLGFDMFLDTDGKPNWHTEPLIDKPKDMVYQRMIANFRHIKADLTREFPGCTITNVTDRSGINHFPKVPVADFWKRRKNGYVRTSQAS